MEWMSSNDLAELYWVITCVAVISDHFAERLIVIAENKIRVVNLNNIGRIDVNWRLILAATRWIMFIPFL